MVNFINWLLGEPPPSYPAKGGNFMFKDIFVFLALTAIIVGLLSKSFLFHFTMIFGFILLIPIFVLFTLFDGLVDMFNYFVDNTFGEDSN